tara:strand:- start:121 stop:294 length:174 start_codon:yes stop_codon:yes gene_type:complete
MSWTNSKIKISQEQKAALGGGMGMAGGKRSRAHRSKVAEGEKEARQNLLDRFNKKRK